MMPIMSSMARTGNSDSAKSKNKSTQTMKLLRSKKTTMKRRVSKKMKTWMSRGASISNNLLMPSIRHRIKTKARKRPMTTTKPKRARKRAKKTISNLTVLVSFMVRIRTNLPNLMLRKGTAVKKPLLQTTSPCRARTTGIRVAAR